MIEHNLHVYMYALETDRFIDISQFNDYEQEACRKWCYVKKKYKLKMTFS